MKKAKSAGFTKKMAGMPKEVKLVGLLLLMAVVLYAFQLISSHSSLKSQASGITGLVVSDTKQNEQSATANTNTESATIQQQTQQTTQQTTQQQTPAAPSPDSTKTPIKIISPSKGSYQSPGFSVKIEVSSQVLSCYYALEDSGQLTWDRRTKPCRTDMPVAAEHCKTTGADTCYISVEAWSADGNLLGKDSAYYGIR